MFWEYYMRQIVCENNQAPLAPPAAPKAIFLESQQPIRAGGESDGSSCLRCGQLPSPAYVQSQSGYNGGLVNKRWTTKQWENNSLQNKY